mmetsp:Transcript_8889/g.6233  ORF Transcript_8889/g.6233 Transcript_8889/m.6233 type:complete len:191 (-) Transcript_8889:114-686(-)|eukprot:CAMPEP_0116870636 /NCGR_PEP_ID=MMETSP0463-20121206/622_1 /TAXON_ID=181622 /ORGANISM="Strombidinopsis sp, Strain SopsisLIS2011" /LENGTH=190 /DNA_ID=CAMNT_0004507527 /DNA_START=39 /DNA_END=611 /DNA_ORIENTATION=-
MVEGSSTSDLTSSDSSDEHAIVVLECKYHKKKLRKEKIMAEVYEDTTCIGQKRNFKEACKERRGLIPQMRRFDIFTDGELVFGIRVSYWDTEWVTEHIGHCWNEGDHEIVSHEFAPGEYIKKVVMRKGAHVDRVKIVTNHGNKIVGGGMGGEKHVFDFDAEHPRVCFFKPFVGGHLQGLKCFYVDQKQAH